MKLIKYALYALVIGVFFGAGFLFALRWITPQLSEFDSRSFYEEQIAQVEEKVGSSCLDLYSSAYEFAEKDIGELINIGLEGGDWIAVITPKQKQKIDAYDENIYECERASFSARNLGREWPDFHNLKLLFITLRTSSTKYGTREPSARNLKPQALDRLMFNFQNVTNHSTRTPTS